MSADDPNVIDRQRVSVKYLNIISGALGHEAVRDRHSVVVRIAHVASIRIDRAAAGDGHIRGHLRIR